MFAQSDRRINPYLFGILIIVLNICLNTIFAHVYFDYFPMRHGYFDVVVLYLLIILLTGGGFYQAFPRYCTIYRLMVIMLLPYGLFLMLFSPGLLIRPWLCLPALLALPLLGKSQKARKIVQTRDGATQVYVRKRPPISLSRWIRADVIPFLCLFPVTVLCFYGARYAEYCAAVPEHITDTEETELSDHASQLEELTPEQWDRLTLLQRQNALQTFAEIESVHLGLEFVPTVTVERLGQNDGDIIKNGFYQDQSRSITISLQMVEQEPFYNVLRTLLHECRHSFQADLCRLYAESLPSRRNLPALRPAAVYIYEFENYIDGSDPEMYEAYRLQKCETDAREYATLRLISYQKFWGDDIYTGPRPEDFEDLFPE